MLPAQLADAIFERLRQETDTVYMLAGGGAILDMMNYSVDGDLYRGWARLVCGLTPEVPNQKRHAVAYLGRNPDFFERHAELLPEGAKRDRAAAPAALPHEAAPRNTTGTSVPARPAKSLRESSVRRSSLLVSIEDPLELHRRDRAVNVGVHLHHR